VYTFDRKPKDISYYYRANYSSEPVVHLAVGDRLRRSGPRSQVISVYSNLDRVEIFLNGASIGSMRIGPDRKANVSVNFVNGRNLLRAVGQTETGNFSHQAEVYFHDPASRTDIAVNCGSATEVVDASGTIWQADLPAIGDRAWANTGASVSVETLRNILGTNDEPIYQTMREGVTGYRFNVPDGRYEIEMRFVEPKFKAAGERVFDVAVNGQTALKGIDPAAESGHLKHLSRKLFVDATAGKGVEIDLISVRGMPIVSGIKLKRVK
jgi:beta-galactosidase